MLNTKKKENATFYFLSFGVEDVVLLSVYHVLFLLNVN